MNTSSKVIIATLAGVGAGVLIGMLFAPDKGSETRRKIGDKYTDLSDSLRDKISDLVGTVKDEFSRVKSKGADMVNKATGQNASMKAEPKDSYQS